MLVTLLSVIDPAQGADQFSTPVAGARFVGIQLRISPVGGSLQEDPTADTVADDSAGNVYVPTSANIQNCAAFKLGRTIRSGGTYTGCLVFQIETDTTASEIAFTPGGQFGAVSAEWTIP